jgi:hypothetical protein
MSQLVISGAITDLSNTYISSIIANVSD